MAWQQSETIRYDTIKHGNKVKQQGACNKVKQQVCEKTSKNSNMKKQHKTPSLEQQATKLRKQEKHF
jgi:hypothetical protein